MPQCYHLCNGAVTGAATQGGGQEERRECQVSRLWPVLGGHQFTSSLAALAGHGRLPFLSPSGLRFPVFSAGESSLLSPPVLLQGHLSVSLFRDCPRLRSPSSHPPRGKPAALFAPSLFPRHRGQDLPQHLERCRSPPPCLVAPRWPPGSGPIHLEMSRGFEFLSPAQAMQWGKSILVE